MKLLKGDDAFFRKDEDGRNLFYPWGYPGEAFHVNQTQKKRIMFFIDFVKTLLMLGVAGMVYLLAKSVMNLSTMLYLFTTVNMSFALFYIWRVYLLRREAGLYVIPAEKRSKKVIVTPWIIVFFEIIAIGVAINDHSISSFVSMVFITTSIVGTIYISYLALRIQRTKGYLFAESLF